MSKEGKNADKTVEELITLARTNEKEFPALMLELIRECIKLLFPKGKLTLAKTADEKGLDFKVHLDELSTQEIIDLGKMAEQMKGQVKLTQKRSGTGITILFERITPALKVVD